MTKKAPEWFGVERCRALTLMHLTRCDDLVVTAAGRGIGREYVVSVTRGPEAEERAGRQFGKFLRGTTSAVTEEQLRLTPQVSHFL